MHEFCKRARRPLQRLLHEDGEEIEFLGEAGHREQEGWPVREEDQVQPCAQAHVPGAKGLLYPPAFSDKLVSSMGRCRITRMDVDVVN